MKVNMKSVLRIARHVSSATGHVNWCIGRVECYTRCLECWIHGDFGFFSPHHTLVCNNVWCVQWVRFRLLAYPLNIVEYCWWKWFSLHHVLKKIQSVSFVLHVIKKRLPNCDSSVNIVDMRSEKAPAELVNTLWKKA